MKELRVSADKREWRIAFAFDPERHAILLAGIMKGGKNEARLYGQLIAAADERFSDHVTRLRSKTS
jgi:hypothetical protein